MALNYMVYQYDGSRTAGQTSEAQKRKEIFYNETLAPDEIDRLLYPKVFTKATKYAQGLCKKQTVFNGENLIIKGNNLLAISSLLRCYEGQIKCIYIDPPYYFSTGFLLGIWYYLRCCT